jgi:hypothetical protein
MSPAIKTKEDFAAWIDRNGVQIRGDCERILFLKATSVSRIKAGTQTLTPRTAAIAEAFEAARTVDDDGLIAFEAEALGLADICESIPCSVVTALTAASLKGWGTSMPRVLFIVRPTYYATRKLANERIIPLSCPFLPEEVKIMHDRDGRPFRIASDERIVIDCVRHEVICGKFETEEVVRAAVADGVSPAALRKLAARYGEDVVAVLDRYLAMIG